MIGAPSHARTQSFLSRLLDPAAAGLGGDGARTDKE